LTFWLQVPITGNSFANDELRALATRWCFKIFHGGFSVSVSHLIISGYSRLLSWLPGHPSTKRCTFTTFLFEIVLLVNSIFLCSITNLLNSS
jgi:hypothetical protein